MERENFLPDKETQTVTMTTRKRALSETTSAIDISGRRNADQAADQARHVTQLYSNPLREHAPLHCQPNK